MTDQERIETARARMMEVLRLLEGVRTEDVTPSFSDVTRAVRRLDAVAEQMPLMEAPVEEVRA